MVVVIIAADIYTEHGQYCRDDVGLFEAQRMEKWPVAQIDERQRIEYHEQDAGDIFVHISPPPCPGR